MLVLLTSSKVRNGEVGLAQSWQRTIHGGAKNYNEVPAQYSSLAHKRRTLCRRYPFSGCSLERWHKMEQYRAGTASLSQQRTGRCNVQTACDCYQYRSLRYWRMQKRGTGSALLQGKRLGFLIPQPSAFFSAAES